MICKKSNNVFKKGTILGMIFFLVVSFSFVPQKAQAQFIVSDIAKSIWDAVQHAWSHGGAIAYHNALSYVLQTMAKETGEWLASGGKGQKPLFFTNPGEFFESVGDQALGEFIDGVAGSFLGQSLCDNLDYTLKFNILANLDPNYAKIQWAKEPQCSFSQMKKNLEKIKISNIADFSAELKEGRVAKQENTITALVQGDSVLTPGQKICLDGKLEAGTLEGALNWMIGNQSYYYQEGKYGVGAYLHQYTQEFKEILESLKTISKEAAQQPEQNPVLLEDEATRKFQELQERLNPETGQELWGDGEVYSLSSEQNTGLKALNEVSAECVRNSNSICDNPDCVTLCDVGGTSNCSNNESDCLDRLKRIKTYSNQLIEWSSTLQDMVDQSIENWRARQAIPDLGPLEDSERMFNPESNALGIQMSLESKLFAKQAEAIEKSKFFRQLQGSMNAVTSKVSGLVKWPSTLVDERTKKMVKDGEGSIAQTTQVAAVDALNVLASTFLQQFMKRMIEGSLNPSLDAGGTGVSDDFDDPPSVTVISVLSGIKIIPLNQSSQEMTIYDEFAVCPSGLDQKYISQFNCLIDNKLSRAMEEKLTLAEAMERGLLNPAERLGIEGNQNNLLSKPNLQKLRLIGAFPLGMEIAHQIIIENQQTNGLPLSEVVANFNQRGADGICGTDDTGESPYCNLVDPNWVLRADSYLCELTGYSAIPGRDSSFRQESCLDFKSCISESEGNCDTWSYCTRSKNIWRFDGDECDSQYNSCASYVDQSNGETYSYLAQTLDFENCDSSNVGCQWYCKDWDPVYSGVENWSCSAPGWREYNCNLEEPCDDENGCDCDCDGENGCPVGLGSCLVVEGASYCTLEKPHPQNTIFFSSHVDECQEKDEGCSQYIRTSPGLGVNFLVNGSFELGFNSAGIPLGWMFSGGDELVDVIGPEQGTIPNGSEVLKIQGDSKGPVLFQTLNQVPPFSESFVFSGYYKSVDNSVQGNNKLKIKICYDASCSDFQEEEKDIDLSESGWKYNALEIFPDKNKLIDHLVVEAIRNSSQDFFGTLYLDSFQVRNESGNSVYREYGSRANVYLKSAPQWMNCYDPNPDNHHVDCGGFLASCSATEVGCELYTSISNQGTGQIPATVQEEDSCPSACVGYETFEEIGSYFDQRSNRWVEMIPSTAKKCSAPGCEEFTNLDALSQGGEAQEYYTYLRGCVKTNEEGLAIVDFNGEEISPASSNTCQYYYTWVGEEDTGYQLKSYYLKKSPTGGPLQVSLNPDSSWGQCDENNLSNPHCRQFYDDEGNIYYRFYKNTISCSSDCKPYRRAIDDSLHMAIASEGEICRAQDLGCREYKGSSYGALRNLFEDGFLAENIGTWEEVEISTESLDRFGYSIQAKNTLAKKPVSSYLQSGGIYALSLWVKGGGNYTASLGGIDFLQGENQSVVSNEWQEIKFGTIYFNQELTGNEKLFVSGPNGFYLDNIILNKVEDDLYLIKDSWKTPSICDLDRDGNISLGYMVGCQAYQDRAKNYHYLKSFSRLCAIESVGCEALIDTANSGSPFSEHFNSDSPSGDEVTIAADSMVYRIYNSDYSCALEKKGCQKFGQPELNSEEEVIGYQDVFLINDPDTYQLQSTLCDFNGYGCQEYSGPVYFKDPGDKLCEYKENVSVYGEIKNGWFKKDTDNPCYSESGLAYQPYGSAYGIRFNDDPLYSGWAGICPGTQDGCTQFIDPLAQNLILNSGLEKDVNEDGVPDYWDPYALPNNFNLQNNGCLSGQCWFIDTINDTAAASQYIKINPGSVYQLSAWVKVREGSAGTIKIYLAYVDQKPSSDWIDVASVVHDNSLEGQWQKLSVSLEAPFNAQYARVLVPYVSGLMEVHVDNISLVEKNSSKGSYYFINNSNLDRSSCAGTVGVKDGCVLFNDTSLSGRLPYDSASTYALSQENNDLAVNVNNIPPDSGAEGDSNVILKVQRDRDCGEWLHCSGYRSVWDSSIDDYRKVCDSWVRCDQLIGSGQEAQCGHVVYDPNPQVLSPEIYQERDVSWKGRDYLGYSLLNTYPLERLITTEDESMSGKYQLTYFDSGNNNLGVDGEGKMIDKSVHVYPEKDSPFKKNVNEYYNKVNLCNSTSGEDDGSLYPDCQGAYKKVEYGDQYSGQTKYFNFDDEGADSKKFCKISGADCSSNPSVCSAAGDECLSPLRMTDVVGLRGFCLEPDESKPEDIDACVTWWPGAAVGDMDVFNMYHSAGYQPEPAKKWYCASDDSSAIFGENEIVFQSLDYHCVKEVSSKKTQYFYLSDGEGGCSPSINSGNCRVNNKGGDDVNSNMFKSKEIEKIEVYLGADQDSAKCHNQGSRGYVILQPTNDWWAGRGHDASNPSGPGGWPPSAPSGGAISSVKACFNQNCDNFYTEEDYLHHFLWSYDDDSYGSGGAATFGKHTNDTGVRIYLKNGCQYVVNAIPSNSDSLAIAYTDRLWEYDTDYYPNYYGDQECVPYGVANVLDPQGLIMSGGIGDDCEERKANIVYNQNGLQNLFVKVDEVKEFNSSIMEYEPLDSGPWSSWDLREEAGSSGEAPQISSKEGNIDKFNVGQYDSGNIGPEQSPYVANFKFYAWANAEHMPLREISIDWDDGETSFHNVMAKNHKPECDGLDFGSISDSCVSQYFSFNHTYLCQQNSPNWEDYGCQNMCCFKPKVDLKDNWNWCLGGFYAGDEGNCKDKDEAGVYYDGLIRVRPQ